jgi:hypothetical protein
LGGGLDFPRGRVLDLWEVGTREWGGSEVGIEKQTLYMEIYMYVYICIVYIYMNAATPS